MSITGSLLGTAIGDALGLPYEGLSRRRAALLLGPPDHFRLLPGRGMISDDTEHACITAQALIESERDPARFSKSLARRLRRWLLAIPPGVGFATLRGITKSALGISPERSGVRSAGNGPAMRAPVLGAAVDDPDLLRELVRRSTLITHRDERAEWGAYCVALAARHARTHAVPDRAAFLAEITERVPGHLDLIAPLRRATEATITVTEFADELGLGDGVSGFIDHTVPVAIYAWLRHPDDVVMAATECVRCGGDTDSVAAIASGIVGAGLGAERIPREWLERLFEWPRTPEWIAAIGEQSDTKDVPFTAAALRNVVLLAIVLAHGLRRAFPPY